MCQIFKLFGTFFLPECRHPYLCIRIHMLDRNVTPHAHSQNIQPIYSPLSPSLPFLPLSISLFPSLFFSFFYRRLSLLQIQKHYIPTPGYNVNNKVSARILNIQNCCPRCPTKNGGTIGGGGGVSVGPVILLEMYCLFFQWLTQHSSYHKI